MGRRTNAPFKGRLPKTTGYAGGLLLFFAGHFITIISHICPIVLFSLISQFFNILLV
jgi:hypothetical protein